MSDDVVYNIVANTAGFTGPMQAASASTAELAELSRGLQAQIASFQNSTNASSTVVIHYSDAIEKSSRALAEEAAIAKIAAEQQTSLTAATDLYIASLSAEARARDAAFASITAMNRGLAEEIQARRVIVDEMAVQEVATVSLGAQMSSALAAGVAAARVEVEKLTLSNSRLTYSLSALITDAFTGQFSRARREVAALANEMGLLRLALSPIGLAIIAVIAALAALIIWLAELAIHAHEVSENMDAFNKSLVLTNGQAGQTASQLESLTESVAKGSIKFEDASKAVLSFAQSGQFAGVMLTQVVQAAATFAELTGKNITEVQKQFEELAKNPVQALEKLQSQTHLLDASTIALVASVEASGNKFGAQALAVQAVSDAMEKAKEKIEAQAAAQERIATLNEAIRAAFLDGNKAYAASLAQKLALEEQEIAKQKQIAEATNITGNVVSETASKMVVALIDQNQKLMDEAATYNKSKEAIAEYTIAKMKAQLISNALSAAEVQYATDIKNGMNAFSAARDVYTSFTTSITAGMALIDQEGAELRKNAAAQDAAIKAKKDAAEAARQAAKDLNVYTEALKREESAQESIDALMSKYADKGDPIAAIWKDATKNVQLLVDKQADLLDQDQIAIDHATTLADKIQAQAKYVNDLAQANFDLAAAETSEQNIAQQKVDLLGNEDVWMQKIQANYQKEEQLAGMTTAQRRIYNEVLQAETEFQKLLTAARGKGHDLTPQEIEDLRALAAGHVKVMEAVQAQKQVEQELQNAMSNGLDSIGNSLAGFATRSIKTWHDLGQSLVGDTQQFIAQIIQEMLKLTVFNGILNSIFGSNLPTMGFGSMLSGIGSLFSGGGMSGFASSFMGGGAGGGGGMLGTASNLYSMGKAGLGMFGDSSAPASSMFGAWSGNGVSYVGGNGLTSGLGVNLPGGGGVYTPSMLGEGLGIAGGLYAGYNEYNAAGGGAAGLLGGAAYGIGTLGLAGGLGSMALGGTFAAGMAGSLGAGAAAGAGMTGLAAAIPVVGWVALIAMGLNMLTGGGLFGTSYKPTGAQGTDLNIGADGTASLTNIIEESKKKALFGGRSWRDVNVAATADQQAAIDKIASGMQSAVDDATKSFGVSTATLLSAGFKTWKDAKGNTTTTGTVGGVAIAGESQQDWATREIDDSILAAIDKLGGHASAAAVSLQGDVKALDAFTQAAVTIQANLKDVDKQLMGAHGNTFDSVLAFVKGLQQNGETLVQTYQRLVQAAAQYQQFVAQFAPAKTYVDSFEASLAAINDEWAKNTANANALAQAAGAQGASDEDLLNIQKHAIAETQQLVLQLESSAQQLAFSLGLTSFGSLDQVTNRINELESKSKGATSSISGFGNTIQQVSQQASAAMSLLLGNLSPLNDQEKLQAALAGLRNGTATVDDVLTIGRRLYASSEAYTELFNSVKDYAGAAHGGGRGGGGGGGSSSSGSSGLTPAEQAELKQLLAEQAAMQKAARVGQDQTLVTQIAEIAAAKSEDFRDVLKDMGINESDLLKELGVKDDASLASMIAYIQAQKDSDKNNTTSIVGAITMLPQQIADAIAGKNEPVGAALPGTGGRPLPGTGPSPGAPPSSGPGTGTGGGSGPGTGGGRGRFGPGTGISPSVGDRTMTDADAKAFGDYVAKALGPLVAQFVSNMPRSARTAALPR